MKAQLSPAVIAVVVVLVLGVAGFLLFKGTGTAFQGEGAKPPGMPSSVAEEWKKYTGSAPNTGTATVPAQQPTAPR